MERSLTDTEMRQMLGSEIPVMIYSDLINNGVLNTLLDSPEHCVVFLVRQAETSGHWCVCFLKTKGKEIGIHIYDSYGNPPDGEEWKKHVSLEILKQVQQEEPYLLTDLYNSGYKIYFNQYRHQSKDPRNQSCGRHCITRCSFLDLDTDEYNKMITSKGVSPDNVVFAMTEGF